MLLPQTTATKRFDRVSTTTTSHRSSAATTTTRIAMRKDQMKSRKRRSTRERRTADEDPRGAMEGGANSVSFEHGSHDEERALVQSCSTTPDPYTVLPLRSYRSAGSSHAVPWSRLVDSDANVPPYLTHGIADYEPTRLGRDASRRGNYSHVYILFSFYFSLWLVTYQTTLSFCWRPRHRNTWVTLTALREVAEV